MKTNNFFINNSILKDLYNNEVDYNKKYRSEDVVEYRGTYKLIKENIYDKGTAYINVVKTKEGFNVNTKLIGKKIENDSRSRYYTEYSESYEYVEDKLYHYTEGKDEYEVFNIDGKLDANCNKEYNSEKHNKIKEYRRK